MDGDLVKSHWMPQGTLEIRRQFQNGSFLYSLHFNAKLLANYFSAGTAAQEVADGVHDGILSASRRDGKLPRDLDAWNNR
jgi:hypothetical protein